MEGYVTIEQFRELEERMNILAQRLNGRKEFKTKPRKVKKADRVVKTDWKVHVTNKKWNLKSKAA